MKERSCNTHTTGPYSENALNRNLAHTDGSGAAVPACVVLPGSCGCSPPRFPPVFSVRTLSLPGTGRNRKDTIYDIHIYLPLTPFNLWCGQFYEQHPEQIHAINNTQGMTKKQFS